MSEGAGPPTPPLPLSRFADALGRALRAGSGRLLVGRRVRVAASVGSTNDEASASLRGARDPAALDGWAFLALHQERGRGRLGRTWTAPAGSSFLGSAILAAAPPSVPAVTACAALAVADAVASLQPMRPTLRWPNDVFVGGRKIAGILVEARGEPRRPPVYVAGVGINVNQAAEDFPDDLRETATSVRILRRSPVDLGEAAAAFLLTLDRRYAQLRAGEIRRLETDFLDRLGLGGREVLLSAGSRSFRGRLEALSFAEGVRLTDSGGPVTFACETVTAIAPA